MRLGLYVRIFLGVIIIAILLIGFRVYRFRLGSNLNVTPDAQREIEKAKRR